METKHYKRCDWAEQNELEKQYHDTEWGVPVYDDRKLFEMLILEGMQAGLSWSTILSKRESLRSAYDNFDPAILINYDENKIEELMQNKGVIRNRLKIKSVIGNAHAYYKVQEQYGSLQDFLWKYVDYKPIQNQWSDISMVPASTALSDTISRDLKKLGFKFVGTTIVYAFMQAVGMVNDHLTCCYLHNR